MNHRTTHDEAVMAAGGGFAAGLLWGVVLGGAVALLLAPTSGTELRGQMSDATHRLGRRAKDGYDKAKETYERAGDAVGDVTERVRDLASTVAQRTADLGSKVAAASRVS